MSFGIPQLLNQVGADISTALLLTSDVLIGVNGLVLYGTQALNAAINDGVYAGIPSVPISQQWGIYDTDGNQVLIPDTVMSVEYRNESRVPDYPVEGGTFAQYNKTAMPYTARVQMAIGSNGPGSKSDRTDFLDSLDQVAGDFNLYNIVTPEKTYNNANVIGFDYRRTATSGAGVIVAEVSLVEIRVSATPVFSNPQNQPDTANVSNNASPATPTTVPPTVST